eukprot:gnl/MRDRNA2_/MRDRNA2_109174_c0_seq1.p1 gnl/MRDRNA2_/MRDRNA2_109174_c0~~gnl/MRDRNA2_/MRDRNA2_109174_c0_seq1.p1  ORF type:complete len:118 (+),score=32.04 gnl/MRDRNA2_/MRDRNA2_109174_c0_seq1:79-432(+)
MRLSILSVTLFASPICALVLKGPLEDMTKSLQEGAAELNPWLTRPLLTAEDKESKEAQTAAKGAGNQLPASGEDFQAMMREAMTGMAQAAIAGNLPPLPGGIAPVTPTGSKSATQNI